jgi:glycosyltransferase involved in cell wall biosynthesis
MPLVEAMASGVPVAASRVSAIPEVCRDAAVYFEPEDPESMAEKVVLVLEDESLRQTLIARGKARARDFSWKRAAEQTLAFYGSMIRAS